MQPIKYIYEAYDNRDLPEEAQGYAMVTLMTAADENEVTNKILAETMKAGKKIKIDHGKTALINNKKHCPKVFNITNPLTDEVVAEMAIEDMLHAPEFKDIYQELSNVISNMSMLKEGIKKK